MDVCGGGWWWVVVVGGRWYRSLAVTKTGRVSQWHLRSVFMENIFYKQSYSVKTKMVLVYLNSQKEPAAETGLPLV